MPSANMDSSGSLQAEATCVAAIVGLIALLHERQAGGVVSDGWLAFALSTVVAVHFRPSAASFGLRAIRRQAPLGEIDELAGREHSGGGSG